ncbi:MAG: flippase-like domain-containing protein [Anaerolineales bacterium]|nr:flippase-like domain-containing protein [Anaerolineales bacterium]
MRLMRRLVLAAVLLLATILLVAQFGRLGEFVAVLRQGHPGWLALAFGAQALWQAAQAAQWLAAHRAVRLPLRFAEVLPAVLVNNFALLAVPSGSLSTFALFTANARQRGRSPAAAGLAVMVFAVFNYLVLAGFALTAAVLLAVRGQLNLLLALPVLAVLVEALGQYALLLWALRAPAQAERAAQWALARLNAAAQRVARRDLLAPERLAAFSAEAADGLAALRAGGRRAHLWLLAVSLAAKLLLALLFALVLRAFGQPAPAALVIVGVSLSAGFSVVSPTPQGVGVTEGAVALALTLFGLPLETGLVVMLAYRALGLWWPFVVGFATLQLSGLRLLRGAAR